jgi:acyl carrier protein
MNQQLNEILARVFNLENADTITDSDSLIADLGADSLDFVEIIHLIERTFGVVIKTDEIMLGGSGLNMDELFDDGSLTAAGAVQLKGAFPAKQEQFRERMTKVDMFSLLTVADLAAIINAKLEKGGLHA